LKIGPQILPKLLQILDKYCSKKRACFARHDGGVTVTNYKFSSHNDSQQVVFLFVLSVRLVCNSCECSLSLPACSHIICTKLLVAAVVG